LEGILIRGAQMHVQMELAEAREGLRVGAHLRTYRHLFPVCGGKEMLVGRNDDHGECR
jgi:hypothetical protein